MNSNDEEHELADRLIVVETKLDITNRTLENVEDTLRKVQKEIIHYKGWMGGILFILSALAAAFQLFKEWILSK